MWYDDSHGYVTHHQTTGSQKEMWSRKRSQGGVEGSLIPRPDCTRLGKRMANLTEHDLVLSE